MATTEYKQLGFVDKSAREAMGYVEGAYSRVKGIAPGFVLSPTEKYIGPLVSQAQDMCQKVLHLVDGQVDSTVHFSQGIYKSGVQKTRKVVGDEAADQFSEAKNKYYQFVLDMWNFFKKEGAAGSVSALINRRHEAAARLQQLVFATIGFLAALTHSIWDKTRNLPPVQKVVAIATPYVDWAQGKYMHVHDALVDTPQYAGLYKLALGIALTVLSWKMVAWPLTKSKQLFYPYIQWIVDPALQQVDPYVKTLQKHVRPSEAALQATAAPAREPLPASSAQKGSTSKPKAPAPAAAKLE